MPISRRKFIELAASFGASLAFRSAGVHASTIQWRERRDLYPQGVASGDPHPDSVILWTRHPPSKDSEAGKLIVEISADPEFRRVIATARATLSPDADWTTRVLAAGLKPRRVYWYRFTDEHGFGSRIGRTITAPAENDNRPVSFTFVSCQNVQMGGANAYRRMIWEDERKPADDQLGFVLHLGDFVYEVVWYPEDRPKGYYARRLRDIVRYPHGEKIRDFHVPTTVDDYRALYRGYLLDPDLQDARARWPFVCMWDNHEFSWKGWQSQQDFSGVRPAQTRKVAANQAWFEYQPARVANINSYHAPAVRDTAIREFDDHGLGLEPGNLAAINSLKIYRAFRWGRNVELILTDNRSYRSEPVMHRAEAASFQPQQFPYVFRRMLLTCLMVAGNSITEIRLTRSYSTARMFQILVNRQRRSRCLVLSRKHGSLKSCVFLQCPGNYGGIQSRCSTGVSTSRISLKVWDRNGLTLVTRRLAMTTGPRIVMSAQKFWTSSAANRSVESLRFAATGTHSKPDSSLRLCHPRLSNR